MNKPLIAVTMGDPTGIGPEIIARALAQPTITDRCNILVLGDEAAMQRAIQITGEQLKVTTVPEGLPLVGQKQGSVYLRPVSEAFWGGHEFREANAGSRRGHV